MGFKVKKNTFFSTYCTLLLLLYAPLFWNVLIFTKLIVLRKRGVLWLASYPVCCDWPAIQCTLIGQLSSVLWLASYPVCSDWPAIQCAVIGQLSSVLWLASYPVYCDWPAIQCAVIGQLSSVLWLASYLVYCDWPAIQCTVIGQLSSVLWLAEYLKHKMEMLRPLPLCDAVSRRDETETIKPIINEAFRCLLLWSEKLQTTSTTLHCSRLNSQCKFFK